MNSKNLQENIMDLKYSTSSGYPGGFVAEAFGYMCFIIPQVAGQSLEWRWIIQTGGGWANGDPLVTHCEGIAICSAYAENRITEALENDLNSHAE
jgi:hypothetical protein